MKLPLEVDKLNWMQYNEIFCYGLNRYVLQENMVGMQKEPHLASTIARALRRQGLPVGEAAS